MVIGICFMSRRLVSLSVWWFGSIEPIFCENGVEKVRQKGVLLFFWVKDDGVLQGAAEWRDNYQEYIFLVDTIWVIQKYWNILHPKKFWTITELLSSFNTYYLIGILSCTTFSSKSQIPLLGWNGSSVLEKISQK